MTFCPLERQWRLPSINLRRLTSIFRLPRFLAWRRSPKRGQRSAPAVVSGKQPNPAREAAFDPHSFYPAAWLARRIVQLRPSLHADIGSYVTDVGILSAYAPVIFVGDRPLYARLPGLASVAGDITRLPFPDKSLISLSSLQVIEHVGLGRNGDAGEPPAAMKALGELQRVLGYRGSLYLSTLVGRERTVKGQQIFAPLTIVAAVPLLRLRRFSYVGDDRLLHADASLDEAAQQEFGCGMFEFERS
jgi:hypothetical protein